MSAWHLYVVRTRHGALYTGVATDVERRVAEHGSAAGAKYLRSKSPLQLVYRAELGTRSLALKAERRLKSLTKRRKEALIAAKPDGERLLALLTLDADASAEHPGLGELATSPEHAHRDESEVCEQGPRGSDAPVD